MKNIILTSSVLLLSTLVFAQKGKYALLHVSDTLHEIVAQVVDQGIRSTSLDSEVQNAAQQAEVDAGKKRKSRCAQKSKLHINFDVMSVGHQRATKRFYAKYADGSKLFHDHVWGLASTRNTIHRLYERNFYELLEVGELVVYRRKSGKYNHYYFSTSLKEPIYRMTYKNLGIFFSEHRCIIQKEKELRWWQSISSQDKNSGKYYINVFIQECNL